MKDSSLFRERPPSEGEMRRVYQASEGGVRIRKGEFPLKSPWLKRLAPPWGQGKRAMVEPARP
jgi:hypothetical protein